MAKQRGILKLSGTLGGMTFYKLGGRYYVRRKSSLDRRRVCQDPAFARSRAQQQAFRTSVDAGGLCVPQLKC